MQYSVSDSLYHTPERCTVVATYKRLVVGVAILSSPRVTYITYLVVRAGWDNVGIARYGSDLTEIYLTRCLPGGRSMLYHLIMLNPDSDITLHVSANSSAMVRWFCPNWFLRWLIFSLDASCCITGLVSRPRNLLLGFTKIIWIHNLVLRKMPLGCAYDNNRTSSSTEIQIMKSCR